MKKGLSKIGDPFFIGPPMLIRNVHSFGDASKFGTVPALASNMSKLLRGLAAGYGAKKLGGGCLGTIIVFILLWMILGNFDIFR